MIKVPTGCGGARAVHTRCTRGAHTHAHARAHARAHAHAHEEEVEAYCAVSKGGDYRANLATYVLTYSPVDLQRSARGGIRLRHVRVRVRVRARARARARVSTRVRVRVRDRVRDRVCVRVRVRVRVRKHSPPPHGRDRRSTAWR